MVFSCVERHLGSCIYNSKYSNQTFKLSKLIKYLRLNDMVLI